MNIIMKKIYNILLLGLFTMGIYSCNIDTVNNPNGPTQEAYISGASLSQLQLLTNGLESILRNDMEFYYNTVSIVGREYYDLNGTDPRYTGELLGAGAGDNSLDNNGFLTTRSFAARYRAIRNAEILMQSVANNDAGLDAAGIAGFNAFAKTMKAHQMLLTLNRQFNNGVRLDVADADNLGPFSSYNEGLAGISDVLSEAIADCGSAGSAFQFSLSSGFEGFDTPSGLAQVANALKARVEMYAGNKDAVRSALQASFMDAAGDLNAGVYHVFSGAGGDQLNPQFFAPGVAKYMSHPSFLTDGETGDTRLGKVADFGEEVVIDGLSATHQAQVFASNVAPFPIVRNEELVLLMAEANIGSNNTMAASMINVVRAAAGLGDFAGDINDDAALENELLHQRRYSLYGEGHRWLDMRRYGRLGDLPLDRAGDQIFEQFPRPVLEGN
jgi:hypothetical protein